MTLLERINLEGVLFEIAQIFLRLGATSFGGPLAHIALMRREFVDERGWLSDAEFLDLSSAVNLIPGPNSTELAMHIGYKRAGVAGLWVAGGCFILPAAILVVILAALYARWGILPSSRALLQGVSPVVVVLVAEALGKFAPAALKNRLAQAVALLSLFAGALGISEVAIIFAAALVGIVVATQNSQPQHRKKSPISDEKPQNPAAFLLLLPVSAAASPPTTIFWAFLKIGSIIYGSGYVLLAYMRAEFVENLGWITDQQLLDAIAIGQMTPGPLFTSATFIGYQMGGVASALAATVGIFLPPFVFVMLLAKKLGHLTNSPRARRFLDCINAASFALMTLVTLQLARAAFLSANRVDFFAVAIAICAAWLLWKTKWNPALLLVLGALIAWIKSQI